jgi:hypothetical protein
LAIILIASAMAIGAIVFVLLVGRWDIPAPEPVSPFAYLDERKAAIYDNLRDLQFEFRVGKLSDADYQNTKRDLQKELAAVMAEADRMKGGSPPPPLPPPPPTPAHRFICPSCGTEFPADLKFCGECGKPMKAGTP